MAERDAVDGELLLDPPAAMIDEAGVMIAGDPHPVDLRGEAGQQGSRIVGEAVAAEAVVEAVAEAIESGRAAAVDVARQHGQRGERIIGRQELAEAGEPAGLFEMEVGDEQRGLARPEQRAIATGEEIMTGERSGNHGPC